eukprot:5255207-Prymnesium_polylepis.1
MSAPGRACSTLAASARGRRATRLFSSSMRNHSTRRTRGVPAAARRSRSCRARRTGRCAIPY